MRPDSTVAKIATVQDEGGREVARRIDTVRTISYINNINIYLRVLMATTNINIRTDSELKTKAQSVLTDLGLDMSTAINMFLNQIVYKQAIPFEISKSSTKAAKFGGWEGKISMSDDFNEPMEKNDQ